MRILVLAEHDKAKLSGATLLPVTAAQRGSAAKFDVLVAGYQAAAVAAQAAADSGRGESAAGRCRRICAASTAENVAAALVALVDERGYSHVLAAATDIGQGHRCRGSRRCSTSRRFRISSPLNRPDTFVRPIYAGNALATVQSQRSDQGHSPCAPTAFEADAARGRQLRAVEIVLAACPIAASLRVTGQALSKSDRPELASARSSSRAGAAMASARKLSSCSSRSRPRSTRRLGASRAAVDAGYIAE